MTSRSLRPDSTEYLNVDIAADVDISTDLIEISLDGGITWHETEHTATGVRVLVGPSGGLHPLPAREIVLIRIHDTPEVPVITAGVLYMSA